MASCAFKTPNALYCANTQAQRGGVWVLLMSWKNCDGTFSTKYCRQWCVAVVAAATWVFTFLQRTLAAFYTFDEHCRQSAAWGIFICSHPFVANSVYNALRPADWCVNCYREHYCWAILNFNYHQVSICSMLLRVSKSHAIFSIYNLLVACHTNISALYVSKILRVAYFRYFRFGILPLLYTICILRAYLWCL